MKKAATPAAKAREEQGLTLEQAAKLAGFTPRTLTKYEQGEGPSPGIAKKLGRVYGCTSFLFTRQAIAVFEDKKKR